MGRRKLLAMCGFILWAALIGAYWTFHLDIIPPLSTWRWVKEVLLWPYTLDEDATWAVLTHFSGFAIFVALADGSKRSLLAVLIVALGFFWLLQLLQIPTERWAMTTNYVGFAVMFVSSVVGLGLFSALAQLLTLLRTLLGAHPELEKEIRMDQYPLLMIAVSSKNEKPEDARSDAASRNACSRTPSVSREKCFLCGAEAEANSYAPVCAAWCANRSNSGKLLPCTPYASMREKLRVAMATIAGLETCKAQVELSEKNSRKRLQEVQEQAAARQEELEHRVHILSTLLRKNAPHVQPPARYTAGVSAPCHARALDSHEQHQRAESEDCTTNLGGHAEAGEGCAAGGGELEGGAVDGVGGKRHVERSKERLEKQKDFLAEMLAQAASARGGTPGVKREVKQLVEKLAASLEVCVVGDGWGIELGRGSFVSVRVQVHTHTHTQTHTRAHIHTF